MASAACQAMGTPEAQDMRRGLSSGPIASAASPTAYTSGRETERIEAMASSRGRAASNRSTSLMISAMVAIVVTPGPNGRRDHMT